MSGWLATAAAISFLRKKESPIAPFKRTAELAEREQQKALKELEEATCKLVKIVSERMPNES